MTLVLHLKTHSNIPNLFSKQRSGVFAKSCGDFWISLEQSVSIFPSSPRQSLVPIFISSFPLLFINLFPLPSPPEPQHHLLPTSSCQLRLEEGPRTETCSYHFLVTAVLVTMSRVTTAIMNMKHPQTWKGEPQLQKPCW